MKSTLARALASLVLLACAPSPTLQTRRTTFVQTTGKGWAEGRYEDGVKVGHWVYYDANGRKLREGGYLDGQMDGVWTFYMPDGQVVRIEYLAGSRMGPALLGGTRAPPPGEPGA